MFLLTGLALCLLSASAAKERWIVENSRVVDEKMKFYIHMKQCNTEQLEKIAYDVSNPSHSSYGKHLTSEQVTELLRCPDHESVVAETSAIFREAASQLKLPLDITVLGNSLRVETSAIVVETVFRTPVQMHLHQRTGERQTRVASPAALRTFAEHVGVGLNGGIRLITGLSERRTPTKYTAMTASNRANLKPIPGENDMYTNITNWMVNPRLIRKLYSVPKGLYAQAGSENSQGVAAFNDFYTPSDLCAAHTLLSGDGTWLTPPDITYHGPNFNPGADEVESDLDTQYITSMAPKVTTWFVNQDSSGWILDWAMEATTTYAPSNGGPYVWSISYGYPEIWQCSITDEYCTSSYDPTTYLDETNTYLQALAAMGVSIFVSSGDDGAPGFSATCPIDPDYPIWAIEEEEYYYGDDVYTFYPTCPFEEGCQCATAVVSQDSKTCTVPSGLFFYDSSDDTFPGTGCDIYYLTDDCQNALNSMASDTSTGCTSQFGDDYTFWSTCTCDEVPTATVNGCTASGYVYDSATYGSMFAPDFPTSSPWVTSVGATMMQWVPDNMCAQGDVLSDPSTAQTAQNLFTSGVYDAGGGFSGHFTAPDYQKDFTEYYLTLDIATNPPSDAFNGSNRGYPDIAALGNAFVIVVDGQATPVGGTSASSPTFAGMIALMNDQLISAGRPPLGFLNPLLYKLAGENSPAINKVKPMTVDTTGTSLEYYVGSSYTVGGNFCSRVACCQYAYFGSSEDGTWDPVTGLGTLNFTAFADYLNLTLTLSDDDQVYPAPTQAPTAVPTRPPKGNAGHGITVDAFRFGAMCSLGLFIVLLRSTFQQL